MHNFIPNKFYFINNFKKNSIDKLDKNTGIIYRNYNIPINLSEIIKIRNYIKKKGIKFYLSNNFKLSLVLKLDGTYIPSFNKSLRHLSYSHRKDFIILGSAHNIKEIRLKETQKLKLIFLSSIFKKNKNYLGIHKFKNYKNLTKRDVVALGGISKINRKKLKLLGCRRFSGISYFE